MRVLYEMSKDMRATWTRDPWFAAVVCGASGSVAVLLLLSASYMIETSWIQVTRLIVTVVLAIVSGAGVFVNAKKCPQEGTRFTAYVGGLGMLLPFTFLALIAPTP